MKVDQNGVMKRKMKKMAAFWPALLPVPRYVACSAVSIYLSEMWHKVVERAQLTAYESEQDTGETDEKERSPAKFFNKESAEDVAREGAGDPERGEEKRNVSSPVVLSVSWSS